MTGLRLARKVDSQATMNGRIPGQYCFLLDQVCTNHVSNQASKPDISYKYGILIDPLLWSHTFSKRRLANAPSYLKTKYRLPSPRFISQKPQVCFRPEKI